MSKLPSIPLPTNSVEIGDTTVSFRSLTRKEALRVSTAFKDNVDAAEIFILACGVGVTEEEASNWRDSVDPITAGKVIDGIIILTGLAETSKEDDDSKNL